ncbi:MAG: bacillithiol biosynthesis deacetylase BshB1 [Planctomycetes bacterium]|nr:bacillithiol biosynthesis deacetylase BshB1 [Planctomycetota bacterium]
MPDPCPIVVFAAHPDDAELACGGLLLLARRRGVRAAVVDLTRGESATRGDPETRAREAEAAAEILGLAERRNLGLPDGAVDDGAEARTRVIGAIRELRPIVVIAPEEDDLHPDHGGAWRLVRSAFWLARSGGFLPEIPPHRPAGLLRSMPHGAFDPDIIVDVTDVFAEKMRAIRAHASQFGAGEGPATRLSDPGFLEAWEARHRVLGQRIGVRYGEPYRRWGPLPMRDPLALWRDDFSAEAGPSESFRPTSTHLASMSNEGGMDGVSALPP